PCPCLWRTALGARPTGCWRYCSSSRCKIPFCD
ncbi:hypothetical protein, partial [Bacillus phage SPG24]